MQYLDYEGLKKYDSNIKEYITDKLTSIDTNTEIINEISRITQFGEKIWFRINFDNLILNPFNTEDMTNSDFILLFDALKSYSNVISYSCIVNEYTFKVEIVYEYRDNHYIQFKILKNSDIQFLVKSNSVDIINIDTREGQFNSKDIFPGVQIELNKESEGLA